MTRPGCRLRPFAPALVALCLLLLLGCVNPFKPADPEPPSGDVVLEKFGSIEDLLDTMAKGLENRHASGSDAYLHALADSTKVGDRAFRAFYDPAVKQDWVTRGGSIAPEPWDITLERRLPNYLFGIRPVATAYLFQWSPDPGSPNDDIPPGADTAFVHRHYQLLAAPTSGDPEIIAVGFADLSLEFDGTRWSLFRWNDRVDPSEGASPANPTHRTFSWRRLDSLGGH